MPLADGYLDMPDHRPCLEVSDFRRYQGGTIANGDMIFKDLSACHHDLPKQSPVSA